MKNLIIKIYLILSISLISSCVSIPKINISEESAKEIKDKKFTISTQENELLDFISSSFTTNFIGILVPYGLVWIPKINGKNKAKKYDLKDPRASFEEKISDILTKKYDMKFEKTQFRTKDRSKKELSKIYKDYEYVADIKTVGAITYFGYKGHGFNFAINFRLIDTNKEKEVSNITCQYLTPEHQFRSLDYYYDEDAQNLKDELQKSISECLIVLNNEI